MSPCSIFSILSLSLFLLFPVGVSAQSASDFYRLSNIEDALSEGDCARFGGMRFDGDVAAMANTLSQRGEKFRGYNNVIRYRGSIYVLWSYRSGLMTRSLEFCIFR